jgi:nucleotide-binding universal stress UspA family protein
MIKTILVPTSGSDTDQRVFATALSIARPLGAHIEFIHVRLSAYEAAVRTPHVEFCVVPAITSALHDLQCNQGDQSAKMLEHVNTFCSNHEIAFRATPGVSPSVTAEIVEEIDHAGRRLLTRARHSDLLVLGRSRHADLMPYDLIETLLLGSGRPIVIAPDSLPPRPAATIVVGWQETPAAARALSAALPLLKIANRVVLGASKTASPLLLQVAPDLHPDLLVVGGYSHSPLRESILGGTTRSLLEQAETPVFMMH